jgi:hypothetical protein
MNMKEETIYIDTGSPPKEKRFFFSDLSEDIWAMCIGGFLIITVLVVAFFFNDSDFKVPAYQWANGTELLSKVVTGNNLLLLAGVGVVFLVPAGFASFLSLHLSH